MSPDRPLTPARSRAALARVDAELAAARVRRERLALEREMAPYVAGCRDPEDLDVAIAGVEASIAELEADREDLVGGAPAGTPTVAVPLVAPANDVPAPDAPAPEYLTTREAAALLGVSVKGLEALRARSEGPPFIRLGRAVRYRRDDLLRAAK